MFIEYKLLSLQFLPYLWKEVLLEKSRSQNTRAYRLHFVNVESSAFSPLLRPGVLYQTEWMDERMADWQKTEYSNPRCTCAPRVNDCNTIIGSIYSPTIFCSITVSIYYEAILNCFLHACRSLLNNFALPKTKMSHEGVEYNKVHHYLKIHPLSHRDVVLWILVTS